MLPITPMGPDILQNRAQALTKQIFILNENLASLTVTLSALRSSDNSLLIKVLNKLGSCISAVCINGMLMDVLLPALLDVIESKTEATIDQRNNLEIELRTIEEQIKALGLDDQGVQSRD